MRKNMQNSKKGVLEQLSALGLGVAGLAITLVVVFLILSQTKSNAAIAADSNATAALSTLQSATATIPQWVPIIIITFVGAILIGLVMMFRKR